MMRQQQGAALAAPKPATLLPRCYHAVLTVSSPKPSTRPHGSRCGPITVASP